MDNILFTPPRRDGAVGVGNDLTHLFSCQFWTALVSTAILDELEKAENNEHGSAEAQDAVLKDVRFRLEFKETHGRDFGSDPTDLHPLPVARDGSTLEERDLC